MKKLTRAQWFVLILTILTVAIGVATNFATVQSPAWVQTYPWLTWVVLGGLVIVFVVVSLFQARESQRDRSPSSESDQPAKRTATSVPVSPYVVGPPIEDPAHFYGRGTEVEQFFAHINAPQPQPLQVLGIRRAGKTSFLRYVSHPDVVCEKARDDATTLVIYVDLQAEIKAVADFYMALAEGIHRRLPATDRLALPAEGSLTKRAFEKWLASPQLANYRLIVLLDEFETLRAEDGFDADFFKGLRSLVSRHLAWVTTSYRDLYRLSRVLGECE